MDDQVLQSDIEVAEAVDEHLQDQSTRIEDIQGSLEALTQAIAVDKEPVELTEHQQELVDGFKELTKDHKGQVYAVADKAALEGFVESTAALVRKAVAAFSKEIPQQFKVTAKGLTHYVDMAQRLRERLLHLRPQLAKRDFPYVDVFEYGAYSRFFQVAGKSLPDCYAFEAAMQLQNKATRQVLQAASSYGVVVMEKLLKGLQELRAGKSADSQQLLQMRDDIAFLWRFTWKEAEITPQHGQTPQVALNEFPDRKFTCMAPLLDNRYLVAHEPKSDGGQDPAKIAGAIRHYGAALVFDNKADKATEHCMAVPNVDTLLEMLDATVTVLSDLRGFGVIAEKNNAFAKEFAKAADLLSKQVETASSSEFYGFVTEYFKLAIATSQSIQQPYVKMAWMYIRCAMVVTALVELAALEDPKSHVVSSRFFAKQTTEFSNPAMESFRVTQKALQAAKRASVA